MNASTATKAATPTALHSTWYVVVIEFMVLTGTPGLPPRPACCRRQIMTTPRPFSIAASGSISGSDHGASHRTARCAMNTMTANARPYSASPAGRLPFSPRPAAA